MRGRLLLFVCLASLSSLLWCGCAVAKEPADLFWHTTLDNTSSITVDGGQVFGSAAQFVPGAIDYAFAGNGSTYASWDDSAVEAIFGDWDDSAGWTVDLYFEGDHWSTHTGDSGLWSVVRRYNDAFIIASVQNGHLRLLIRDASGESTQHKYLLTGVPLIDNKPYRLTMRQYDGAFEAFLDGVKVFAAGDLPAGYTCPFVAAGGGVPRRMDVGNRGVFGGILQTGEWVDNVRVYNNFYTPQQIDVFDTPMPGDIDDDGMVCFRDLDIMMAHWLDSDCNLAEGDLDNNSYVDFNDFAILSDVWLAGTQVQIVQQPTSIIVDKGETAAFNVSATGPELVYQWQKDNLDLSDGDDITGAATDTLQIANVDVNDEGVYRCMVRNSFSAVVSDEATLTLAVGPPTGRQTLYEATTGRRYILYVPVGYTPTRSYPLIISSHGTSQDGDTEMDSTGPNSGYDRGTPTWPTLAEDYDVIVACPDMTGAHGNPGNVLDPGQLDELASDDEAIMHIVTEICAKYNIDVSRTLITGFSGGGHVAHYTGLRHPDVFRYLCARHGNFNVEETPVTIPDASLYTNVYIFTGVNDSVYGTDEAIAWYTDNGFKNVDTNDFDTYPSSEHTTDRDRALSWFLQPRPGLIGTSPGGHYITYNNEVLMLDGDSGTQCATQNTNLDYRSWIDDCYDRGIRAVHVWAFIAARQKQDGSKVEARWGYVYPDVTPWARKTSGPLALDQKYQWNLQAFDEGPAGDYTHYWPRMRDMASYAKSKNMLLGVTIFTGWAKPGQEPWEYHPFNTANGGHLTNASDAVIIDTPGVEIWRQAWSDDWPKAKKTQWIWERFSLKLINDLGSMGNVFFVFFDEHSYSDGNMAQHFADFFHKRGMVWMDQNSMRSTVDLVMNPTLESTDKNSSAVSGFNGSPARPYFLMEGHPYMGDGLRTSIWTFSLGGGSYFFQGDADQETVVTGIMGYDPHVVGGDKGMYKRDWLGYASRFFNEQVDDLDSMAPANGLSSSGTHCLADPGREYVVYSMINSPLTFTLDLSAAAGKTLDCRFYNPRTGQFEPTFQRDGANGSQSFIKPDSNDWVLHILAR